MGVQRAPTTARHRAAPRVGKWTCTLHQRDPAQCARRSDPVLRYSAHMVDWPFRRSTDRTLSALPAGMPSGGGEAIVTSPAKPGDGSHYLGDGDEGCGVGAAASSQGDTTSSLIDWRSTNRRQFESGIMSSFGEHGEPLEFFADSLTPLRAMEDDDVEVLNG